ncbi:MAG: DNA polymerase III subunit delta' [Deltaproteobacteria bacterium]|nr:DNA polymerase III subunit delta' [Deltaproteobacteria bacterium]
MPFELTGQVRATEILRGALERGQVHHAYLFGGPEGAGKELAALRFVQALNCEKAQGVACGTCGECKRIANHGHPDVNWVMPEQELIARKLAGRTDFSDAPSRDIRVAQVRKLIERLALKALTARRKAAVLVRAERMNPQAQNALLKTLEEPPPETTLILVTSAPDALLPTIRSRCLRVPFVPLPLEQVAAEVALQRKLPMSTATLCARLAQGSLSRALELDADRLAERAELFRDVASLKHDDARPALALAERLSERPEAEWALGMLELWLRDQLLLADGLDDASIANVDLRADLDRAVANQQSSRLLTRLDAVHAAQENIKKNGSPRLQLERLFLEYLP